MLQLCLNNNILAAFPTWKSSAHQFSISSVKHLFFSGKVQLINSAFQVSNIYFLAWRKVFEDDTRGVIDDVIYNGEVLVTALGGRRVVTWTPVSGMIIWDTLLPGTDGHR